MSENDDLGPRPDPVIEDGEPNPGGVDAAPEDDDELVPADLPVEHNPAVDSTSTPELGEGEDTSTGATNASPQESGEQDEPAAEDPA